MKTYINMRLNNIVLLWRRYVSLPPYIVGIVFLLCQTPSPVSGFGQGAQIQVREDKKYSLAQRQDLEMFMKRKDDVGYTCSLS